MLCALNLYGSPERLPLNFPLRAELAWPPAAIAKPVEEGHFMECDSSFGVLAKCLLKNRRMARCVDIMQRRCPLLPPAAHLPSIIRICYGLLLLTSQGLESFPLAGCHCRHHAAQAQLLRFGPRKCWVLSQRSRKCRISFPACQAPAVKLAWYVKGLGTTW